MLSKLFYKIVFIFYFVGILAKFRGIFCLNIGYIARFFIFPPFLFKYFLPEYSGNRGEQEAQDNTFSTLRKVLFNKTPY